MRNNYIVLSPKVFEIVKKQKLIDDCDDLIEGQKVDGVLNTPELKGVYVLKSITFDGTEQVRKGK